MTDPKSEPLVVCDRHLGAHYWTEDCTNLRAVAPAAQSPLVTCERWPCHPHHQQGNCINPRTAAPPTPSTEERLREENARLRESVRRLSYLAVDKGYGVWRCVKCDQRYTTLPDMRAVCGEVLTTYTAEGPRSASCLGKLEPYVYEASGKQPASPASAAPEGKVSEKVDAIYERVMAGGIPAHSMMTAGTIRPATPPAPPATGADEGRAWCGYCGSNLAARAPAAIRAEAANDALERAAVEVDAAYPQASEARRICAHLARCIRALKTASGAEGQPKKEGV